MRNSQVNTVSVPLAGSVSPATLFQATDKPMRIIVRNTGGALLFLAHDASTLVVDGSAGVQGTFQLPVGDSEVFVLAPKQGIYAIAFGNGGQVSMAVSEAVPTVWMES